MLLLNGFFSNEAAVKRWRYGIMTHYRVLGLLVFFLAAPVASALTPDINPFGYIISLSGGPAYQGQSRLSKNNYTSIIQSQSLAEGELFLGMHYPMTDYFMTVLGLALGATGNAQIAGYTWSPTINYTYGVKHTYLAVKTKIAMNTPYIQPYFGGSLGLGFNRSQGYQLDSTNEDLNFTSNLRYTYTYTLEMGLQRTIITHWQGGVGYVFSDWGVSSLGNLPSKRTFTSPFALNHLYTNGLMFTLTYKG